jgi:hypothetical protein
MTVALVALFVGLSGGAYAAVTIPNASVGAAQLRTFAVTNPKLGTDSVGSRKIMPGAVGYYRVNRNEVQLRVTGACATASQAITSISVTGSVTCGTASPSEFDSGAAAAKALATTAASVASLSLAGGSEYMVQADPYITVSANTDTAPQTVDVSCTLASGTATTATETRSVSIYVPAGQATAADSIPLTVVQPTSANSTTASLNCTDTDTGGITDATLNGQATIYATTLAAPTTTTTAAAVRH